MIESDSSIRKLLVLHSFRVLEKDDKKVPIERLVGHSIGYGLSSKESYLGFEELKRSGILYLTKEKLVARMIEKRTKKK